MSQPTGKLVEALPAQSVLARSRARAALIPDLLVEANRVANNVFAGWHGRRRRGIGENFWQFRPYVQGENLAAIDWRRSARDDHVYVKDREWQASHTIWLWVDESASMLYQSSAAEVSKQSRALVLALAMAELLARSGERIGWLGVSKPIVHRHAAERLASDLIIAGAQENWPDMKPIGDHAEVVLFSDFLESREDEEAHLAVFRDLSDKRVRGHLVQIVDPAEEVFSYAGRMEFRDPETSHRLNLGSAQTVKQDYEALFAGHTRLLADYCQRLGWSHTLHHTDQLASRALQSLHISMSENPFEGGG